MTIFDYFLVFLASFLAFVYTLPTLHALYHGHDHRRAIFAVNILVGWTGIGWVIALVWSLTKQGRHG